MSLFDWIPKESDLLSEMILGLKGERQKRQWLFWSQQFLLHHNEFRQQGCFVSCWNKSSQPEHAEIFAQSLHRLRQKGGRLQNLRYHDVFQQSRRGLNFKKLGRKQRQNQLKDREIFSQKFHSTPSEKVIFVDDILTTGSTAEIAFLSLGKPPNFEVWSLAYRTNLAPF